MPSEFFIDKTRCQTPTDSGEMLSQCHSPIQETLLELQFYFNWWEYPEVRSQKNLKIIDLFDIH